ncbi:MAG: hypothetical protein BMS9Abin29_2536 [Gemmatimonadota bacterium]|nr:MAG: hypothetical protein BMS9Abin29_2536 [Gemmatimonadota bacterium]
MDSSSGCESSWRTPRPAKSFWGPRGSTVEISPGNLDYGVMGSYSNDAPESLTTGRWRSLGRTLAPFILRALGCVGVRFRRIRFLRLQYCRGDGVEVGAGTSPSCPPLDGTVMVDQAAIPPGSKGALATAESLPFSDGDFDFLLSAHCLEHCPNTLAVLEEWLRVLSPGGILFLVLPHGERTFDRGRALTTLAHHIEDYTNGVTYGEDTHLAEFEAIALAQYDPEWMGDASARLDDGALDWDWMITNGLVHYHVWTEREMKAVALHLGCEILRAVPMAPDRPDSFVIVARKTPTAR